MDLSPTTIDDLPTDCSTNKDGTPSTAQNNNSTMLESPFYCFETNYETFRQQLNGTYHLTGDQDLITYTGLHDTLIHFRNTRINESLSSYLNNILGIAETTTSNNNHQTQDNLKHTEESDDSDTSSSDDSTSEEDFDKAENTLNTTKNDITLDNLKYIDKTEDFKDVESIDENKQSKQNCMDCAESANVENNDGQDLGVTKQPLTILETAKKEESTVDDENFPQLDTVNEGFCFEDEVSKNFIEQQSEICKPNQENLEMNRVNSCMPKIDHAVSNNDNHFLDINTSSSSENIYSLKYIYKELYGENALRARLAVVARNEKKSNCTETCEPPSKKFASAQNEECLEETIVNKSDTYSSQDEEHSSYKSNLAMITCDETISDSCSSDDVSMNTMLDVDDWKFSSSDSE